jgi:hypothetical protein
MAGNDPCVHYRVWSQGDGCGGGNKCCGLNEIKIENSCERQMAALRFGTGGMNTVLQLPTLSRGSLTEHAGTLPPRLAELRRRRSAPGDATTREAFIRVFQQEPSDFRGRGLIIYFGRGVRTTQPPGQVWSQ